MSVFDETWTSEGRHVSNDGGRVIAMSIGTSMALYRAQLAAAAPDLYRALKLVEFAGCNTSDVPCCPLCMACNSETHTETCELRTALAKAEGR
jgi:hypothetical protein